MGTTNPTHRLTCLAMWYMIPVIKAALKKIVRLALGRTNMLCIEINSEKVVKARSVITRIMYHFDS